MAVQHDLLELCKLTFLYPTVALMTKLSDVSRRWCWQPKSTAGPGAICSGKQGQHGGSDWWPGGNSQVNVSVPYMQRLVSCKLSTNKSYSAVKSSHSITLLKVACHIKGFNIINGHCTAKLCSKIYFRFYYRTQGFRRKQICTA